MHELPLVAAARRTLVALSGMPARARGAMRRPERTLERMDTVQPTPEKPGWYWDPRELEHNLALRERWRQQVVLTEPAAYRLRRWDGHAWTGDTLRKYTLPRGNAVPHLMGPGTPIRPLTPAEAARNLKIWAALMVVGTVMLLVSQLAR